MRHIKTQNQGAGRYIFIALLFTKYSNLYFVIFPIFLFGTGINLAESGLFNFIGVFFFVAGPLMLASFSENEGGGPPGILIILFVILALFMDVNILNITHELGLKRAIIVFVFIFIPFAFVVGFIIFIISNV